MQALPDLLRMAAAFERIDTAQKTQFGGWLMQRLQQLDRAQPSPAPQPAKQAQASRAAGVASAASTRAAKPARAGTALAADPDAGTGEAETWWALGRVGARQPLYASAHHVLPAETAQAWLQQIERQTPDWAQREAAAFAVAQIARATGDRARDLPEALRQRIADQLDAAQAAPSWAAMVREVKTLDAADTRRVLGDALPVGLVLLSA
ncbi:MAG: hypothetical protein EOO29_18675 [Comamonadaceae bacterium]|nr:MAG: hypothetical protein EOO29_18675 [Comamonadaceae bacterium]